MSVPQTEVLVFVGGQEIARHILGVGTHVFGSAEACDIRITAPLVSRRHMQLTVAKDGALLLEDLGSTNGTFLDGQRITAPTPVTPNQSIQIGDATLLVQQQSLRAEADDSVPPELSASLRYEPGAEIAKGGMGAILAARQPAIRREVALKVMMRHVSAHDRLRFIEEAQITGQLEHPNIVPVHDLALNEHGQPYYTMKLVKGRTLKEILKLLATGDATAIAQYPLAALLTIFQKVCDAVAFAHARGVIHRDLKPANIMVGEYGEVLLMDWGLAKVVGRAGGGRDGSPSRPGALGESALPNAPIIVTARDDQHDSFATLDGAVMGTPQYMSPEQARGEVATLDARSDLFSLGAILYELVTLLPPFPGKTTREILSNIKSGHFVLPNARLRATDTPHPQHLPGGAIPDSLEAVISKALALDPDQRYQHVADFQADLNAYQTGFATAAENAGLGKQLLLALRRHRREAAVAVTALLLLLTLAVTSFLRIRSERDLADKQRQRAESSAKAEAIHVREAQEQTKKADAAKQRAVAAKAAAEELIKYMQFDLQDIEKLVQKDSDNADWHRNRAISYEKLSFLAVRDHRWAEAAAALAHAVEIARLSLASPNADAEWTGIFAYSVGIRWEMLCEAPQSEDLLDRAKALADLRYARDRLQKLKDQNQLAPPMEERLPWIEGLIQAAEQHSKAPAQSP